MRTVTVHIVTFTFVINNRHNFKVNSEVHNINTRTKSDLHHPSSYLLVFQKETYYAGIKVFNSLPVLIKDLSHNKNTI
jgi:hypothetical protein